MNVLIVFLLVCFVVGGSNIGQRFRVQPWWLLGFAALTAASFYSLRVVL